MDVYVCTSSTKRCADESGVTIYCDQILTGSNKQDETHVAVISMLEAFLTQLKEEHHHIKTVTLQSDNAAFYQSKELLLLLAILNGCNKIKVTQLYTY